MNRLETFIGDTTIKYQIIAETGDLDNPPDAFLLKTTANATGFPTNLDGNNCLVIQGLTNNSYYTAQLAFGFGSNKIAIRRKYNSTTWTSWAYVTLS